MEISFIIPFLDKFDSLIDTINSIKTQSNLKNISFEIIVVDNGVSHLVANKLNRLQASDTSIRVVKEEQKGASFARNRGVKEAKYQVIAFLDADVILSPKWVEKSLHFIIHNKFIVTQGMIKPSYSKKNLLNTYRDLRFKQTTKQKGHLFLNDSAPVLNTAACMLHKDLFNLLGGFNTTLKKCEDNDFTNKIIKGGGILLYVSDIESKVFFNHGLINYLKRNYQIGFNYAINIAFWLRVEIKNENFVPLQKSGYIKYNAFSILPFLLHQMFRLGFNSGKKFIFNHLEMIKIQNKERAEIKNLNPITFSFLNEKFILNDDLRLIIGEDVIRVLNINTREFIDLENEVAMFINRYCNSYLGSNVLENHSQAQRILKILINFKILKSITS